VRTTHTHRGLPIGAENCGSAGHASGQPSSGEFLRPARGELAAQQQADVGGRGAEPLGQGLPVVAFQGAAHVSFDLEGRDDTPRLSQDQTVTPLLVHGTRRGVLLPVCARDYSPLRSAKRVSTAWRENRVRACPHARSMTGKRYAPLPPPAFMRRE
jgi:hypothetical protein